MNFRTNPLCLVIETDRLIPKRFDGFSFGPIVLVRPGTSAGLLAHELVHVEQFWRRPFTHALRYQFSAAYRQACEVEAYRAQLSVNGRDDLRVDNAALALARKYSLNLTHQAARLLLTKAI